MKYKVLIVVSILILIVGLTYASDNTDEIVDTKINDEFRDTVITLDNLSSRQFINTFNWFEKQDVEFNIKHIVVEAKEKRDKYHFSSNQIELIYKELVDNFIRDLREIDLDLSAEVSANGFMIRQVKVYTSKDNIELFVRDKLRQS